MKKAVDGEVTSRMYNCALHYRLTPEAKGTRLSIADVVTTKPACPFKTREENNQRFVKAWANYKAALEKDYKASAK